MEQGSRRALGCRSPELRSDELALIARNPDWRRGADPLEIAKAFVKARAVWRVNS
jgi:hypothetical protein